MNSVSNQKSKLMRLIDFLESEKKSRRQAIAAHSMERTQAREAVHHIDNTYLRMDMNLSIFHGYHVKFRHDLETKITRLTSEIDAVNSEVRNLDKAASDLWLRLRKLQQSEALKTAEIEVSEFIARNYRNDVSLGQGRRGILD